MYAYADKKQLATDKKKADTTKMPSQMTTAASNVTGIPDPMKLRFENLSGFSFDDVRVHYNSNKPAQLQALAYTQGNDVYIAQGQEKHLTHELRHVVQQKRGTVMPTKYVGGLPVNDETRLENEADSDSFYGYSGTDKKANNTLSTIQRRLMVNEDWVACVSIEYPVQKETATMVEDDVIIQITKNVVANPSEVVGKLSEADLDIALREEVKPDADALQLPEGTAVQEIANDIEKIKSKIAQMIRSSESTYTFATERDFAGYIQIKYAGDEKFTVSYINVGQGTAHFISYKNISTDSFIPKQSLFNDLGPNPENIIMDILSKKWFRKNTSISDPIKEGIKFEFKKALSALGAQNRGDALMALNAVAQLLGEPEKEKIHEQLDVIIKKLFTLMQADVLITHGHADHNAGLTGVATVHPGVVPSTLDSTVDLRLTGMKLLGDNLDDVRGSVTQHGANARSMVSYVEMGNTIFIFPGDKPVELLKKQLEKIDLKGKKVVFSASHHGSRTGIDDEMMNLLYYGRKEDEEERMGSETEMEVITGGNKVTTVISAGIQNQFQHPHEQFSTLMDKYHADILSTQQMNNRQGSIKAKWSPILDNPVFYTKKRNELISKRMSASEKVIPFKGSSVRDQDYYIGARVDEGFYMYCLKTILFNIAVGSFVACGVKTMHEIGQRHWSDCINKEILRELESDAYLALAALRKDETIKTFMNDSGEIDQGAVNDMATALFITEGNVDKLKKPK